MKKIIIILILVAFLEPLNLFAYGVYQKPEKFIAEVFSGNTPPPNILWITKSMRIDVKKILGRDLGVLRMRFWERNGSTVWILEEIGKEKPITVGFVVKGSIIANVKVLIFRESRGDEVRHSFFLDQFRGATLESSRQLDRNIDGISGATLSVRALIKLSRLALYLHNQSGVDDGAP